jgi:hypothetical protein
VGELHRLLIFDPSDDESVGHLLRFLNIRTGLAVDGLRSSYKVITEEVHAVQFES